MEEEVKVSELSEASTINDSDLLMIVQEGANKKATANKIVQEGTWTPTLSTTEGAVPTTTYTTRTGSYKKIGNMVFISFCLKGSISALTGTNNYGIIAGLPFTVKQLTFGENAISTGYIYNISNTTSAKQLLPYSEGRYMRIQYNDGAGATVLKVTPTGESFTVSGSGWYETE